MRTPQCVRQEYSLRWFDRLSFPHSPALRRLGGLPIDSHDYLCRYSRLPIKSHLLSISLLLFYAHSMLFQKLLLSSFVHLLDHLLFFYRYLSQSVLHVVQVRAHLYFGQRRVLLAQHVYYLDKCRF